MKKKRMAILIIIIALILILSTVMCLLGGIMNKNEQIKIAIYPSSGGLSETYYFEIKHSGKLLVEKGDRVGDDLTQNPFMQQENPHEDDKNIMYEFSHETKRITKSETEKIYNLVDKVYEDTTAPRFRDVLDGWDIQILYKDKIIMYNCYNDWEILQELIDELISISPIDINLREFA